MAKVTPFRGLRYNPAVVDDMAAVLCPPYDLITPRIQQALMERHPLNVIHLEAGEGLDWSQDPAGRYAETSHRFAQWLSDGVLQQDAEPGYYLLRHSFTLNGREQSRLGLVACVGLEDYDTRQVLPHEFTEAPAIRDRVKLMESVSANISPIMSIYRDSDNELGPVFRCVMAGAPEVDARDEYGSHTTLWRIADEDDIAAIAGFFASRPVFLADGHHRYEASRHYQLARHAEGADGPSQAHNYVMMTLIAFDDPGLVVLPYHRNLSGLSAEQLARVKARLYEVFGAEPAGELSALSRRKSWRWWRSKAAPARSWRRSRPKGRNCSPCAPRRWATTGAQWPSRKPGCWKKRCCAPNWATPPCNTWASCTTTTKRRRAWPTAPCKWPSC